MYRFIWKMQRLCVDSLTEWRLSAKFLDAIQCYYEKYALKQFQVAAQLAEFRVNGQRRRRIVVQHKDVQVMTAIQNNKGISKPHNCMKSEMRRLCRVAGAHGMTSRAMTHMQMRLQRHLGVVLNATTLAAGAQGDSNMLTEYDLQEGIRMLDLT